MQQAHNFITLSTQAHTNGEKDAVNRATDINWWVARIIHFNGCCQSITLINAKFICGPILLHNSRSTNPCRCRSPAKTSARTHTRLNNFQNHSGMVGAALLLRSKNAHQMLSTRSGSVGIINVNNVARSAMAAAELMASPPKDRHLKEWVQTWIRHRK